MTETVETVPTVLRGRRPTQVASLVPDLVAGVEAWSALLGVESKDWLVYTYSTQDVPNMRRPSGGDFAFRLALCGENPQYELIQPLDGESIYTEWIAEHGHGMHHLGFHLDSIAEAMGSMSAEGFVPIHQGTGYGADGDGGFAYYNVPAFREVVIELIEVPSIRRPSEQL